MKLQRSLVILATTTLLVAGTAVGAVVTAAPAAAAEPVPPTLLNEQFSTTTVPQGWTFVSKPRGGRWRLDDPGQRGNQTGGTGGFAILDGQYRYEVQHKPRNDAAMVTPLLHRDRHSTSVVLTFKTRLAITDPNNVSNLSQVQVSLPGTSSWTTVWSASGATQIAAGTTVQIDLTGTVAAGQHFRLRFNEQIVKAGYWEVDDVLVAQA